ncbi:NUDIX hydrolase [Sphingobacterium sp. LRF_L2]|uniref:NUDIX hydrolase n=1 Tax=Sphingobacterium sp. LRF_L2 TaxID=3369421 RepID=UPI003F63D475
MKASAGILLYKQKKGHFYYFLVHPGGPFWRNKDFGAWSIPKGEIEGNEVALDRAIAEFKEETGQSIQGNFSALSPIRQKSGKTVYAWAVEGDLDNTELFSNSFDLEWPPKSGKIIQIPEVDRWEWFPSDEAKKKVNPAQIAFINEVEQTYSSRSETK